MKTALITGVSKGIGRAIAERFLKEGFHVHGTYYQDKSKAEELITGYGKEKITLHGPYDFTCLDESKKLLNELLSYNFDAVVFNAGIFSENDDFNNFSLDEFNATMNCNFYTPLVLATGLRNNISKDGSIVIMSSNDAYPGAFSSMSYSISKAACISLMKCLSVNFGEKNVRVNSVAPGAIDTDMNTPEQMNIAPYFTPIHRAGTTEDVAKVVYFLASDQASFISGENITIDGGYNIVSVLLKSEADKSLSENLQTFIDSKKL